MRQKDRPIAVDSRRQVVGWSLTENFDALLRDLIGSPVYRPNVAPAPPVAPGVYLFAEADVVLHVGRTRNLQQRRREQTSLRGGGNAATFAFRMARAEAMREHADLPTARAALAVHAAFAEYLERARERTRRMDFRCVRIEDDAQQAMFEIFASVTLGALHNEWRTH